jgi:hypothetical protein
VNTDELYAADEAAYQAYWAEHRSRDVELARSLAVPQ